MRYHYEKPQIYLSMYGSVLTLERKPHGGARLIRGLRMTYICIQTLRSTLISGLELARMAFIRL